MRLNSLPFLISALCIFGFLSCSLPENESQTNQFDDFELFYETDQFSISEKEELLLLKVKYLYKGSSEHENYLLYPRGSQIDSIASISHYIAYPVSSLAISSSTHLGFIDALGMQEQISGATNLSLYYSEEFINRIKQNKVTSLGGADFDEEKLIQLAPDVFFSFALNHSSLVQLKDLRRSGNTVVIINEYLEADPLEKAAWLRFMACFFGKDKLNKADAFLNSIGEQYHNIKNLVRNAEERPTVMMGLPWKGSWHVSGGMSYQSIFFRDAGADYVWKHYEEEGGVPLDIEVALQGGLDADFWINPGSKRSFDEILDADSRFENFPAIENGLVYSNYKRSNGSGANDYWEKGVVRPDLLLKDLAMIFHPQLLHDHELFFYEKLKESDES